MAKKDQSYIQALLSGTPYISDIINNNGPKSAVETFYARDISFLKKNGNPTTVSVIRDVTLFPGVFINIYKEQKIAPTYKYDIYALVGTSFRTSCKLFFIYNSENFGKFSINALNNFNSKGYFNSTIDYINNDPYAFSARAGNVICEPGSILLNRIIPEQKQNDPNAADVHWFTYIFTADNSEWLTKLTLASIIRPSVSDQVGETWKILKNTKTSEFAVAAPYEIKANILNKNFPKIPFNSSQTAWEQIDLVLSSNENVKSKIAISTTILAVEYSLSLSLEIVQAYFFVIPTRGVNMVFDAIFQKHGTIVALGALAGAITTLKTLGYFDVLNKFYNFSNNLLPLDQTFKFLDNSYENFIDNLQKNTFSYYQNAADILNKGLSTIVNIPPEAYSLATYYTFQIETSYLDNINHALYNTPSLLKNLVHKLYKLCTETVKKHDIIRTVSSDSSGEIPSKSYLEIISEFASDKGSKIYDLSKAAPFSIIFSTVYDHYFKTLTNSFYGKQIINIENDIVKNNLMNKIFGKEIFNSSQSTWEQVELTLDNARSSEAKIGNSMIILAHDYAAPAIFKFLAVSYLIKQTVSNPLYIRLDQQTLPLKYSMVALSGVLIYNVKTVTDFIESSLQTIDNAIYCNIFDCKSDIEKVGEFSNLNGEL